YALGVPGEVYLTDITTFMGVSDFMHGFIKSFIFAFMIGTVCCYKGISTRGGAEGVGKATTGAVVTTIVLILVLDYFLTAILTAFGI
ncbi:MAG: ABC transporter permease, partial [Elusimicrobiaceae bacterium]|nr:ABC transporter permease [Elusimicrobiaceae bacterium]